MAQAPSPDIRLRRSQALRRTAAAVLAGAALGVVCGASSAARETTDAPAAPGAVALGKFHSRALDGTLHYSIFVPAGYASGTTRYPVVYFLHGLPAAPDAYEGIAGLGRSLAKTGREAIVVGAQGARAGDSDPEWHDWGPGRNWETATESELVHWVDGHYRTIASRAGRAIVGVSGGGYGAMLIGIHHPETYSVIQSWSGYFEATDPTGEKPLDLGGAVATQKGDAHFYATHPAARKAHPKLTIGFYVGDRDPLFLGENEQFDHELTAAGIPHLFRIYPGGHDSTLWDEHEDGWLDAAVDALDAAH
jgi:enterochelin esterase-like enzyme